MKFLLGKSRVTDRAAIAIMSAEQGYEIVINEWEVLTEIHRQLLAAGKEAEFFRYDVMLDGWQKRVTYNMKEMGMCVERDIECRPV